MSLYEGWDLGTMRDAGDNAELQSDGYVPASSFTPINGPAPQLLTPQSSTFMPSNEQTQQANHGDLGLGAKAGPPQLEKYASALPPTPPTPTCGRKRGRKKQEGKKLAKDGTVYTKSAKQRRVSDSLRITKPVPRRTIKKNDTITSPASAVSADVPNSAPASQNSSDPLHPATDSPKARKRTNAKSKTPSHDVLSVIDGIPNTQPSSDAVSSVTARNSILDSGADHLFPDHDSQDTIADDGIDDIFNMIDLDHSTNPSTADVRPRRNSTLSLHPRTGAETYYHLDAGDDHRADENLFLLTAEPTNSTSSPVQPTRTYQKLANEYESNAAESVGPTESRLPSNSRCRSRKFKSPCTPKTKALTQRAADGRELIQKPIVRPPFPAPVRDRSPVIGLSPNLLLRTCFRIGEAINQACHANKHGQNVIFELYARVMSSQRNEVKQDFVFCDLFHEKPPYIKGVYDAVIWKYVQLYDYDSERLLEEQRLCRCIGTIKRDGKEWVMVVLNVWEAKWEDIAWVEGIVNA